MQQRPIPDSYWVRPDRLLAGEYPGSGSDQEARQKVGQLLDAGVTFFLDLTEDGEYNLEPYAPFVFEEAAARGHAVEHQRMSIPDGKRPTAEGMKAILDAIDAAIKKGHTVYVHGWGGIGRTGTVVGCHMVRHGMSGQDAVSEIARLRAGTPDGYRRSPETDEQEYMIVTWPAGG